MHGQTPSRFITTAVVVLLAGCSGDSDEGSTTPPEQETSTAAPSQPPATTTATPGGTTTTAPASTATAGQASPTGEVSDVADAVAALQTAAAEVPNGQPFDMERDTHQGDDVWEVKVASDGDEYELVVSIDGADVVDSEQKDSPDDDVAKVDQAQVDAVTALQTAAAAEAGALDEMEIDSDDDAILRWEIELRRDDGSEVEISIDAMSGDIIN